MRRSKRSADGKLDNADETRCGRTVALGRRPAICRWEAAVRRGNATASVAASLGLVVGMLVGAVALAQEAKPVASKPSASAAQAAKPAPAPESKPESKPAESVYALKIPADPPYYRVRYEGSTVAGELTYAASYTLWLPSGVARLRGLVVHQHGCGEGSCKSGQTGAFDLHWQALARKHGCGLLAPVYEQPDKANCQLWCDPRNGAAKAFQKALDDLAARTGHPEVATVPWALWGHSGGGYWAGGLTLLAPERVAAAWLRSGVPPVVATEGRPAPYSIPDAALGVPIMCNLGTKEGVTDKEGRFAGVWPGVEKFYLALRGKGALIAVSIDPLSSHDCGNQRYLAIQWLDACLAARLPATVGEPLRPLVADEGYLTTVNSGPEPLAEPVPAKQFTGAKERASWLPTAAVAAAWFSYSKDSNIADATAPPAPANLKVAGNVLTWTCEADLESGLAGFEIERDGKPLAKLPEQGKNPFGRPLFQNLSYSDTPTQPLVEMRYVDTTATPGQSHTYRVIAINTVGLRSK